VLNHAEYALIHVLCQPSRPAHNGRRRRFRYTCTVARIEGVDPESQDPQIQRVLAAQARKWGAPLLNHLVYARRLPLFRGVRAMWSALDESGLIDPKLIALVNRRVAAHNGCAF